MSQVEERPERGADGFTRGGASAIGPEMERMLSEGQQVMLEISGDSMRPTLKPRRDAAVLSAIESWPPKRGDILFYRSARSQAGYSLHRVVRISGDTLTMNGDAQTWTEDIARDQVLAKAIALLRAGKPVNVDGVFYRAYIAIWRLTRPVRFKAFALWRRVKGILRK